MQNETDGLLPKDVQLETGQLELFSVAISMLCSMLIHHWLTTRYAYFHFIGGSIALFTVEFLSMCLPPLLIHTYFGDNVVLTTAILLSTCFLLCNSTKQLRCLRTSIFREFKVTTLVSTCIVIAAVDCKRIFASQFAKTQTYGLSSMDMGTGLFVAVRALDSLRRDLRRSNAFDSAKKASRQVKQQTKESNGFQVPRFLPLLLIGLARVAFVEFSGYYQDPTEYGTHWNFFISLALIELLISFFHMLFQNDLATPIASVLSGLVYFAVLLSTDFEEYLLGTEVSRNGFLDGNREGICSTFGYLFIFGLTYLSARFFVPSIVWNDSYIQHATHPNLFYILSRNFLVQAIFYVISLYEFGLPSRRVANLTYGLHVSMIVNLIILFMHVYMHCVGDRSPTASLTSQLPTLHAAISRHGSYFFLAANLLTGLLNYSRSYIQTPELEFASLLLYAFVLCLSTQFVDVYFTTNTERRTLKLSQ